jgi:site-specific DNA-cytosine methylase
VCSSDLDVRDILADGFDLMIAHPPCTHLAVSGARWFKDKVQQQQGALDFVRLLMDAPIPRICIENPVSIISSRIRKPDQVIQPWMFGHGETKATCLWLKGLPLLTPTDVVSGREQRIWKLPPSPDRWKERSRTYAGIAQAMAQQWGNSIPLYQP